MRVDVCAHCKVRAVVWGRPVGFCVGCQGAASRYEQHRALYATLFKRWGFVLASGEDAA